MLGSFPLSSHPLSDVIVTLDAAIDQSLPVIKQSLVVQAIIQLAGDQSLPTIQQSSTGQIIVVVDINQSIPTINTEGYWGPPRNVLASPVNGINFLMRTLDDVEIDTSGYALGFYGPEGRLDNVEVDDWQDSAFLVDKGGTEGEVHVRNTKFASASTAYLDGSSSSVVLRNIPNFLATLNLRFLHTEDIFVSYASCKFYDGINTDNSPAGLDIKVAEISHPGLLQNDDSGTGYKNWVNVGDGTQFTLTQSPGELGVKSNSVGYWVDSQHDWYLAISVSPDTIGSRTFGLQVQIEYT